MIGRTETAEQRSQVAAILLQCREDFIRRWMQKVRLLTREKEEGAFVPEAAMREEGGEFIDVLLSQLRSGPESNLSAFYNLILDARQYNIRLADLAYLLLELKSVGKQILFERIDDELGAFRVSRLLDDAVEGVLRRSADLFELTNEADQQAAQERLQEIFTAWELERVAADAETPAELCKVAAEKLSETWDLAGFRCRIYGGADAEAREVVEGARLPVPSVEEQRQYLTGPELRAGGALDVLEAVRRRRQAVICVDLRTEERIKEPDRLRKAGVGSLACCPLIVRDMVAGVILLYGAAPGTFQEADLRRLDDLSSVLAMDLDRTTRIERSHKAMSEAQVITRIGRALLELPTRGALLQAVVEALREFRDYFDVSLFRVSDEDAECRLVAEAGREGRYRPDGYKQKVGEGFIGLCAQTGQTIRASDLEKDSRRVIAFEEEYRARCELVVPVKKEERVLGVMHFLSEREDDFPESEVAALEHVAPHIGVALLNATMMLERQHNLYEIEQAHRQLVNIIRSAAVGITSTDPRGVYTHWSPGCEAMIGYREEEVVGRKTPADFVAEPYDLAEALQRCVREGEAISERTMLRRDGTPRVIRETRVPLEDEDGEHVGFTSYLVDITEQKRAEEQLRRERDTLGLVVGAMGAGLAVFDNQLRLQWANSTLMEWFDFGPEAFGSECHEIHTCGQHRTDACPAGMATAGGQPQIRVQEVTDRSGVWHCYQQVFTPIRHRETSLVVLTQDITEQRRQTEQLRLINKLAERVETSLDLERVLHLVLTCVTAGHAIGLNRAFVFLLDDRGEFLQGKMAVGPVSEADARRIWEDLGQKDQTMDQLLDTVSPSVSDRQLTELVSSLKIPLSDSKDTLVGTLNSRTSAHVGEARSDPHISPSLANRLDLAEFVCVPLAVQNQPLGVMLADNRFSRRPIGQDQAELLEMFSRQASLAIANARAYEKIRAQLDELERTRDRLIEAERMASVGRMASHLAHEIRNPLTAIGGFARAIARQHQNDPRTRRNSMIIYEEIRRLERTLANVLDYTRPLRPSKTPVDINDIVVETVEQFRSDLDEGGVTVGMSLAEPTLEILADPAMIKQVIINLVRNAIDALDNSAAGRLSIETALVGDEVTITIADTGSGMEQETVDNLFSPFFTTKVGGIGLGLSISQRIARQHGGRIESHSELGRGSTFRIALPVRGAGPGGGDAETGFERGR